MAEPSSPVDVDWDVLDAELDGIDEVLDQGRFSSPPNVEVLTSRDSDGTAGRFQGQQDAVEGRAGYCSDEEVPKTQGAASMSVFKDIVKGTLEQVAPSRHYQPSSVRAEKASTSGADIEKFSFLRIKDRVVSSADVNSALSDLRFVRLQAIKTAMMCDKFSGSWATVGILVEKGLPKLSAKGKNYAVWKLGTLEKSPVSLFLFGTAYTEHWKEPPGTMVAIFSAGVRPDGKSKEPCLSVFNRDQVKKLGTSVDYRVCSGRRKDGTPCTMVLNKQLQGQYCQFHATVAQQEFRTTRPELKGGKLALEGPGIRRGYPTKPVGSPVKHEVFKRPLKHITTSELKDLLSNAEKMPTKSHSQGKRFLEVMAERNSGELMVNQTWLFSFDELKPRLAGTNESAKKGVKPHDYQEATKTGIRAPVAEKQRNVTHQDYQEATKTGERAPLTEKQMNVKRQDYQKVTRTGKRAPLAEKQTNINSSGLHHISQTSTIKRKSKPSRAVMEIDTYDDLDDSVVLEDATPLCYWS